MFRFLILAAMLCLCFEITKHFAAGFGGTWFFGAGVLAMLFVSEFDKKMAASFTWYKS